MTMNESFRPLKGKPVVEALSAEIRARAQSLASAHRKPKLAIVRLGERPDDLAYERSIAKRCEALDVETQVEALAADAPQRELTALLERLRDDDGVDGILPFRPLPAQIDMQAVKRALAPEKDVDCIGPGGSAAVFDRSLGGYLPCTAEAVMEMLRFYEVPLAGARAVVLGRSLVVGRALALLLMDAHCTVTVCHSRTRNLPDVAAQGDILVCAMGRARMVGAEYVKPGAVVIDVGINDDGGGICGDADFDAIATVASAATPVPGGIGAVTTTLLVRNVVQACTQRFAR